MTIEISIPPDHPASDGHFPGAPIVPGAVLLAEIASALGLADGPVTLRDAKFTRPVLPGDRLHIATSPVAGGVKFEASSPEGTLALSGTILDGKRNP